MGSCVILFYENTLRNGQTYRNVGTTRQDGVPIPPTPCPAPTPDQSANTGKTGVSGGQTGSNIEEAVETVAVGYDIYLRKRL